MKRFLPIAVIFLLCSSSGGLIAWDYAPIQISLVPGLVLPFGTSDAGIALGPIGNISGRIDLAQAAGVFNIARDIRGLQVAGVFNIASEGMSGIQAAGVFNTSEDRQTFLQLAGVFNIAAALQGSQISGIFNIAGNATGSQIAPIFNIAGDVSGFQLGLVNIAGRMNGIQIGLVNFSSNGVLEFSADWEQQSGYLRESLKTGNSYIFAIYSVAAPENELFRIPDNTVISAGLGTRFGESRKLFIDLSVSASQAVGNDLERFVDAWTFSGGLEPKNVLAPWPTLDAALSLSLGIVHVTAGLRSEISLASVPNLPSSIAKGWSYSDIWFGESFTAWTKWYIGVSL
ncbi:MAG: hypothetical protein NT061_09760 [Spirochaetes bacterium]|nr:hypothetical protein [Spirochaetota bacterium]